MGRAPTSRSDRIRIPADARRVLIHRQGSLGDTVVALPGLKVIADAFPNAERRLLTNYPVSAVAGPALQLVAPAGLVSDAIEYPVGTRNPRALLRLIRDIRAWRPDVAVYLVEARSPAQHRRDAAIMRLCGVRHLFGYDSSGGLSAPLQLAGGRVESEAARLLRAVAELGAVDLDDPAAWDLRLAPAEHARAAAVLAPVLAGVSGDAPVIAFSIGTKAQVNDYEDDNWRAVIAGLSQRCPGAALIGVGAPSERDRTARLLDAWAGPRLNTCGEFDMRSSGAALARANLFVGHDSGPMHLASAVGTPCVAVFSSRNPPGQWYPHGAAHRILRVATDCSPCGLYTCVAEGKRCILSIPPAAVVEACVEVLRAGETARRDAARPMATA